MQNFRRGRLPPAAAGAPSSGDDWPKILALIAQATGDASKLGLDAKQKIRDIDRKVKDLENQLQSLAPAKTEQTEVTVHVIAQSPLDADLTIRYQVPEAHWAPIYDARLQTGSKTELPKVNLARRAAITQKSGENWTNVSLELSTARPSDGSSAPPARYAVRRLRTSTEARCHGRAERRSCRVEA